NCYLSGIRRVQGDAVRGFGRYQTTRRLGTLGSLLLPTLGGAIHPTGARRNTTTGMVNTREGFAELGHSREANHNCLARGGPAHRLQQLLQALPPARSGSMSLHL